MKQLPILTFLFLFLFPPAVSAQAIHSLPRLLPTPPPFFRQGDAVEFTALLLNPSPAERTGQVQLELFDARTGQSVDGYFLNTFPNQYVTVGGASQETLRFPLQVPYQFAGVLRYRLSLSLDTFRTAVEKVLAVLPDKEVRTALLPLQLPGAGSRSFRLPALLQSNPELVQHQSLSLYYAFSARGLVLPSLSHAAIPMHAGTDAAWNRFEAMALTHQLLADAGSRDTAGSSPIAQDGALLALLRGETPWMLPPAPLAAAGGLEAAERTLLLQLKALQGPHGGIAWYAGGEEDPFITQEVLLGVGRLRRLGRMGERWKEWIGAALSFLEKQPLVPGTKGGAPASRIPYLYLKSFFRDLLHSGAAGDPALQEAAKGWTALPVPARAMLATALYRAGQEPLARRIAQSLRSARSIPTPGTAAFHGALPEALLLEAFLEGGLEAAADSMSRKVLARLGEAHPGSRWAASAAYALLLNKASGSTGGQVEIRLGGTTLPLRALPVVEPLLFYRAIEGRQVRASMGMVDIAVKPAPQQESAPASAGWLQWHSFEEGGGKAVASPLLKLQRQLLLQKNGKLSLIREDRPLATGDTVLVRLTLDAMAALSHLHLQDLFAAALRPADTASMAKGQGALRWAESSNTAARHFLIPKLPRGRHLFEYRLVVAQSGVFTYGRASVRGLYAPEHRASAPSQRLRIE
jgi:hypothetical protein